MTPEETAGILSMITAAYPHVYKNLAEDEAKAVVMIWAVQFKDVPADIVFMATNKAIATSKYPPTIAEIKNKLTGLYWEAYDVVNNNEVLKIPGSVDKYKRIMKLTQDVKFRAAEPTIDSMIGSAERYLLTGEDGWDGERIDTQKGLCAPGTMPEMRKQFSCNVPCGHIPFRFMR